ncbi:hypothetical protein [Bartonella sp. CL74QHWL]
MKSAKLQTVYRLVRVEIFILLGGKEVKKAFLTLIKNFQVREQYV